MKTKTLFVLFAISARAVSTTIDLGNLFNYENQNVPAYITKDNTPLSYPITDESTTSLEDQSTKPFQDNVEMRFSNRSEIQILIHFVEYSYSRL